MGEVASPGGVTLRVTRNADGSAMVERVIGTLTMPGVAETPPISAHRSSFRTAVQEERTLDGIDFNATLDGMEIMLSNADPVVAKLREIVQRWLSDRFR